MKNNITKYRPLVQNKKIMEMDSGDNHTIM